MPAIVFLDLSNMAGLLTAKEYKMVTKRTTRRAPPPTTQEQLVQAVKNTLDEAESLLREAAETTGDNAQALRDEAMERLKSSRDTLFDVEEDLLARGRQAVQATDDYVREKPWQAMAAVGLAGLLIGVLISRR